MYREIVVARSHEAGIFTNNKIARVCRSASTSSLDEGQRLKKPEESWLAVHSRVYLIVRDNLMSRTKCT